MQPGEVLDGRYALVEQIGEGAFGAVWKARDARIQRLVAVKVMLPGGDSPKDAARFAREVATAGALNHPSIVTVHDFGRHGTAERPLFFLVMELLDGVPLSRHLADGPLPLRQALGWAVQIAQALATAHRAGVVHRDVKPANVMIQSSGAVKVVDFGIARTGTADDGVTSTNVIVGTPAYMAPERFDSRGLDARSDLYAFGCLLHELLTGRTPFRGTLYELIRQHGEVPPTAPGALRPGLPAELDALVLDLLAKDPAHRPADAGLVAERLLRLIEWIESAERQQAGRHATVREVHAPGEDPYVLARRHEADALLAGAQEEVTRLRQRFETDVAHHRRQAEQDLADIRAHTESVAQQIIADARARGAQIEREASARAAASLRQLGEAERRDDPDGPYNSPAGQRYGLAEQRGGSLTEQRNDLLSRQADKLRNDAEQLRRSMDNARRQASDFLADAVAKAGLGPAPEARQQPRELAAPPASAAPPAPSTPPAPQRRKLPSMQELLSGRARSAAEGEEQRRRR
ncbi:serine/threonine-protein kinase [Kitasatospora sp. SUK 42]|uniref:serine/threonine-protein kinase n=1 Tax=Kitasatospora sp. SUK 42 TaxID=1588882 RepID=UPI0018C9B2A2|nr:serine/threonine-protein kinase [Kitasatospora sp. SUK 42]MBV2155464.1 serine/threonine protein kinase [Kitasatospora sp. SUK 42]